MIGIRKIPKEAKEWEEKDGNNKLDKLKDEGGRIAELKAAGYSISVEGGVVILRTGWSHKGVKSKSTQERDDFAANELFSKADEIIKEWNKKFGITSKTFGGVLFTGTEGGWSDTENPPGGPRKYKAGGTAVGVILVAP